MRSVYSSFLLGASGVLGVFLSLLRSTLGQILVRLRASHGRRQADHFVRAGMPIEYDSWTVKAK